VVPGLLGVRRWLGPRVAENASGVERRPLRGERQQDLEHPRSFCRLDFLPGANQYRRGKASGRYQFCINRHETTGRNHKANRLAGRRKPIVLLDGEPEVNEIFFDNVKVPLENLVGEEGKGWTYGKVLLQHERTGSAQVARSKYSLQRLRKLANESIDGGTRLADDRIFMRKVAAAEVELKALEYTELRTLASISSGKAPGPESSILKIAGTDLIQRIDSLYLEASGYYALPYVREQYVLDFPAEDYVGEGTETISALTYFNHRKHTIFAGSNEIQKNIIAKHVLGL